MLLIYADGYHFCKMSIKLSQKNCSLLYRDNVYTVKVGYPAPGSRSLTQVFTNVHCCHWLPEELSNKDNQIIRGWKVLKKVYYFLNSVIKLILVLSLHKGN